LSLIAIPNYIANDGVVKVFHCMLKAFLTDSTMQVSAVVV